jgi:hypothetical protein
MLAAVDVLRAPRRRAWSAVLLVYGPVAALLALVTVVVGDGRVLTVGGRQTALTLAALVQEPTAVAGLPPWTGLLSTLGGVGMCCAGAVAFAAGARRRPRPIGRELGALTVLLGLDDLLQLHESVVPGLTGLPEEAVLAGYPAVALLIAVRHREALRRLVTPVVAVAVLLLGASVALDVLGPALPEQAWTEDTLKLLGFTGWAVWLASAARDPRRAAGSPPSGAPGIARQGCREVTISPASATPSVGAVSARVDGVAWARSESAADPHPAGGR